MSKLLTLTWKPCQRASSMLWLSPTQPLRMLMLILMLKPTLVLLLLLLLLLPAAFQKTAAASLMAAALSDQFKAAALLMVQRRYVRRMLDIFFALQASCTMKESDCTRGAGP
jgi:hypothetical protein